MPIEELGEDFISQLKENYQDIASLDLSDNAITRIENLEPLGDALTKLSLAGNQIGVVENVASLSVIQELDLSRNKITTIGDIGGKVNSLTVLNLAHNDIHELDDLQALRMFPNLRQLDLRGNEVTNRHGFRREVVRLFKGLELLDGRVVTAQQRSRAKESKARPPKEDAHENRPSRKRRVHRSPSPPPKPEKRPSKKEKKVVEEKEPEPPPPPPKPVGLSDEAKALADRLAQVQKEYSDAKKFLTHHTEPPPTFPVPPPPDADAEFLAKRLEEAQLELERARGEFAQSQRPVDRPFDASLAASTLYSAEKAMEASMAGSTLYPAQQTVHFAPSPVPHQPAVPHWARSTGTQRGMTIDGLLAKGRALQDSIRPGGGVLGQSMRSSVGTGLIPEEEYVQRIMELEDELDKTRRQESESDELKTLRGRVAELEANMGGLGGTMQSLSGSMSRPPHRRPDMGDSSGDSVTLKTRISELEAALRDLEGEKMEWEGDRVALQQDKLGLEATLKTERNRFADARARMTEGHATADTADIVALRAALEAEQQKTRSLEQQLLQSSGGSEDVTQLSERYTALDVKYKALKKQYREVRSQRDQALQQLQKQQMSGSTMGSTMGSTLHTLKGGDMGAIVAERDAFKNRVATLEHELAQVGTLKEELNSTLLERESLRERTENLRFLRRNLLEWKKAARVERIARENHAATVIQRQARRWFAQRDVESRRDDYRVLRRCIRAWRRMLSEDRQQRQEEETAAVFIQKQFRSRLARRHVHDMRLHRTDLRLLRVCFRAWRRGKGTEQQQRRETNDQRVTRLAFRAWQRFTAEAKKEAARAAVTIQSQYRSKLARKKTLSLREQRKQEALQLQREQEAAAISIQCRFRSRRARQTMQNRRLEYNQKRRMLRLLRGWHRVAAEFHRKRAAAATKIQARFRARRAGKAVQGLRETKMAFSDLAAMRVRLPRLEEELVQCRVKHKEALDQVEELAEKLEAAEENKTIDSRELERLRGVDANLRKLRLYYGVTEESLEEEEEEKKPELGEVVATLREQERAMKTKINSLTDIVRIHESVLEATDGPDRPSAERVLLEKWRQTAYKAIIQREADRVSNDTLMRKLTTERDDLKKQVKQESAAVQVAKKEAEMIRVDIEQSFRRGVANARATEDTLLEGQAKLNAQTSRLQFMLSRLEFLKDVLAQQENQWRKRFREALKTGGGKESPIPDPPARSTTAHSRAVPAPKPDPTQEVILTELHRVTAERDALTVAVQKEVGAVQAKEMQERGRMESEMNTLKLQVSRLTEELNHARDEVESTFAVLETTRAMLKTKEEESVKKQLELDAARSQARRDREVLLAETATREEELTAQANESRREATALSITARQSEREIARLKERYQHQEKIRFDEVESRLQATQRALKTARAERNAVLSVLRQHEMAGAVPGGSILGRSQVSAMGVEELKVR